ncbi:hypothetical protein H8S77_23625 [Parabacteroides sp. BX2]|jgi:hypothetical protein|uniref:SecDF P1 head subdomain domain-containing protein n=1 Tax=Parabacteroides segnis TaxID=2763058 RepID=A0ABR7E7X0_9BACT|nr:MULTISPECIES: hypothetical protein [Parabacteroides]MBC5645869.1 hypothetical protein [Parabacteroides segnis]MCM0715693.1 hypothetical protein [Parabacteroides sp. TA-V-105]
MKKLNCLLILIAIASVIVLEPNSCNAQTIERENGWYYIMEGRKDSISKESIITVKDFAFLRLDSFSYSDNRMMYMIVGTINQPQVSRWADATERSIGKRICFVFDNKVITDPKVNARIESGAFSISTYKGYDLKTMFRQIREEMDVEQERIHCLEKGDLTDTLGYKKLERALFEELQKPNFSSCAEDYMKSEAYLNYKTFIGKNPDYIERLFQSFLFKSSPQGLYGYLIDDIIKEKYPDAPSIRGNSGEGTGSKDYDILTLEDYQKTIRKLMDIERSKNKSELSR